MVVSRVYVVCNFTYWKSSHNRKFQLLENSRASCLDVVYALAWSPSCLWSIKPKVSYRRSGNFRCKNIFVVCVNHENKIHKIYFTITVSTFLYTRFHSIYNLLLCARRPLLRYLQVYSTYYAAHGKRVTIFHSVSNKLSVFTTTVCPYSVLQFSFLCE